MNNRISGDFGVEALEAFRAAYAQMAVKPEELEVDRYTGLPTGEITNISPWIQHTGLWRANPGTDRSFVPNQVLETDEDFEDGLSEEDFDRMVDEVLTDLEEEERFADEIFNGGDDDDEDDEDFGDDELEAMIDQILAEEPDEPEIEERVGTRRQVEVPSEDEIDALIQEVLSEIEEEELEEDREESRNREVSDDDIEELIRGILDGEDDDDDDDEGGYVGSDDEDEDDIDALINEILGDDYEDDGDGDFGGSDEEEEVEEEVEEEDIDSIVDEILRGYSSDEETGDYDDNDENSVEDIGEDDEDAEFNALMEQVMADDEED